MTIIEGKQISKGIAIAPICIYHNEAVEVDYGTIQNTELEIERFEKARQTAIEQLNSLVDQKLQEGIKESADILGVHAMMLEDDDFIDSVKTIINDSFANAAYAVKQAGDKLADIFSAMDNDYFRARAADMKDISQRVIKILTGKDQVKELVNPSLLVAKDLAPSETVQMDQSLMRGIITELGSSNSHTAILARTMDIPAVIGVKYDESWQGQLAIADGDKGVLIINPDEATLATYEHALHAQNEEKSQLAELIGQENVTLSGKKVKVYANIANPLDLEHVLKNDAGGIGLFRSEFLYLGSEDYPTEEEQFEAYKKVLQAMEGKNVVIRTLDIGADKKVDYFNLEHEDNPALGYRAIRICLTQPEIFKTQLRALYRASAFGHLSIMYPMITSVEEVRQIKVISKEVRDTLKAQGIPFNDVEQGIMIETPAAAIISDQLAKEVDFFSVGTNDLTQYTLAIDRQNTHLEPFLNRHHDAVLRLIEMSAKNAHDAGIWIGICGELGADTRLTSRFIEMGIDELSVSPSAVLRVRKAIRESK